MPFYEATSVESSTLTEMEPSFEPTVEDIQIIKDWIKQVPYIPQDFDDKFLIAFYRAAKGSLQKTKILLDNFTSLGYKYPDMYKGLDPVRKSMAEHFEASYFFPMPKKSVTDPIVLVAALRPGNVDPYKHHVLEVFRLQLMGLLLSIKDDTFGDGKLIIIADSKDMSVTHIRDLTPSALTAWSTILTSSLPARVQGIHAVNSPAVVEWVFNLIKKVSKEKISQRTFVHQKPEGLLRHISKELLPNEYGGCGGTLEELASAWRTSLSENRDYFIQIEKKIRLLDDKRPKGKGDDIGDTFKKLTVD